MKKEYRAPTLRFSGFKDPWEMEKISDIGENVIGLTYSLRDVAKGDHGILVLRSSNIKNGILTLEDQVKVNTKINEKLFIRPNDILICTRNGSQKLIGKNVIIKNVTNKMTFGAFMSVFRSKNNNFVAQLFKTDRYVEQVQMNLGARINQLTTNSLNNFKFYFPSEEEQDKIVSFLTLVDVKIQHLSHKKRQLEKYKKGVMQQIFSQKIRFKNGDGKKFPEWEKKKLGNIAIFSKGKGISKEDIVDNGTLECIRYGELYTYYGETINNIKSRTNIDKKELVLSKANDIIIPASGETQIDIAKAACILKDNVALGGDLNILKTSNNGVFLSYYLNNKKKNDIAKLAQGVSVVHLYSSQLKELQILLPFISEQQKIASFFSVLDEKIEKVEQQMGKMKLWKKSLLQKMFI